MRKGEEDQSKIVLKLSLTAGGASVSAYGATTPRWLKAGIFGGRGAEERVRGAEPLGGAAAQRRKRASRGYMVPYLCCRHS